VLLSATTSQFASIVAAETRLGDPRLNDRNLLRGLFLIAFSLVFGLGSLKYPLGSFSRAGPGLFPLLVSCLLLLIGLITAIRSRFGLRAPLEFKAKNVALIIVSLSGLAVISQYVNMSVGIVFMVFCSTLAGTSYSVVRNIKISVVLLAIAFALEMLLGLNLPLY
jgi:Tripartite tricarboxylate transporter TctB family